MAVEPSQGGTPLDVQHLDGALHIAGHEQLAIVAEAARWKATPASASRRSQAGRADVHVAGFLNRVSFFLTVLVREWYTVMVLPAVTA